MTNREGGHPLEGLSSSAHEEAEEVCENLSGERLIVLFQVANKLNLPFKKYYTPLAAYTEGVEAVTVPELVASDVRILASYLRVAATFVACNPALWSEEETRLISRLLPQAKTQEEIEAYNERRRQLIDQAPPDEKKLREIATSEAKDESILYEPGNEDIALMNAVSELRSVDAFATLTGKEHVHRVLSRSYLQAIVLALVDSEPEAAAGVLEGLPDVYTEQIRLAMAKRVSDNKVVQIFKRLPGRGNRSSDSIGGVVTPTVGKKFAEELQAKERSALLRIIKQYPNQLEFIENILGVEEGKTVLDVGLAKE